MGERADDATWERDFHKKWESLCLNALGQAKYNETRGLEAGFVGIKEKPYIPVGGAHGNS